MNVLWAGNYSHNSGYANQGRLVVPRLGALGHEVNVFELGGRSNVTSAIADTSGAPLARVLPPKLHPLGDDQIVAHVQATQAKMVVSFTDVWGLNGEIWSHVPWFPLTPIDHMPVPPAVAESVKHAWRALAITRYGQTQLKRLGIEAWYVPCAFDPDVWHPGDKATARRALGWPQGAFIAAFVGVNDTMPSRKGIPELLMAWQVFTDEIGGDNMLYLHTSSVGRLPQNNTSGTNIPLLMQTLNIDPKTVRMVDDYRYYTGIPHHELARIAQAADVLVLPTRGEGFGLPLVEFQACGCPVATTNTAGGAELVQEGGWLIDGEPDWTWQSAFMMKPSVRSIVEILAEAREVRHDAQRRTHAIDGVQQYRIDRVIENHWRPVLQAAAEMWLERMVLQ